jgi:Leucine-rich repeat (LRR) protein
MADSDEMTEDARAAFARAQEKIAQAKAEGATKLDLSGAPLGEGILSALTTLPPEITGLLALQNLNLWGTQVTDITPLTSLTTLQSLHLTRTQVSDLRPLLALSLLWDKAGENAPTNPVWAIGYQGTPATKADPVLKALSKIQDYKERTQKTRAHLLTLPGWPDPLPWALPDTAPKDPPSDPPQPEGPERVIIQNGKLDRATSSPTAADLSDPIKTTLYGQIPDAADALARYGNRFPEVAASSQAIADLAKIPFDQADLLSLHTHTRALQDARRQDDRKPEAERLDPDCRRALNRLLDLTPPVTLGNPQVEDYETRLARFAQVATPETASRGEELILNHLSTSYTITTEALRLDASVMRSAGPEDGRAPAKRAMSQQVVIALSFAAGAVVDGALGSIGSELTAAAGPWLIAQKDAIIAASQGWDMTFAVWVKDMLTRLVLAAK